MKRGLTLLELLVAVALSGIVAFIAMGIIKGEQRSYTKTREKIRLQSDAREGMRILEEEIKNAGYRTSAAIDAVTKDLTTSSCNQALYPTNASFDPTPSTTIYGGQKGLEIRFYTPSQSSTTLDCDNDVWTVGYKYDASKKTFYRQAKKGDPAVPGNSLTATGWVPFLEGVSSFSIEYGKLQENAVLFDAATSMTTTTQWDWFCSEQYYWMDFTGSTGSQWILQNIVNKTMTLVLKKIPLTSSGGSFATDGARSEPLDDKATYRFSFNVSATDNFFDDNNGLPSTPAGAPSTLIKCGFFKADGTPVSTFTFRPVKNAVHAVQYDLVPPTSFNGQLFFGLQYKLKADAPGVIPMMPVNPASIRNMTISSLAVTRLNKGAYDFSSTVPAARQTVQALRLQMTVVSKNETLKFDRIIPMVNNGL